jgi:hypothetical protein
MENNYILFDMDGVLLSARGYHEALKASIRTIGFSLGLSNIFLSDDQIAHFEAHNVTNEWDTLAICSALMLVHCWEEDGSIRLRNILKKPAENIETSPDFDAFLRIFAIEGDLPFQAALKTILEVNPWLNSSQKAYLTEILDSSRDIYSSPTLPIQQEYILGSELFQEHYQLIPKFDLESYLQKYDHPLLSPSLRKSLEDWLGRPNNFAGIMTNRQSQSPKGYLSSPEAELGIKKVGIDGLPYIGSGFLGWFAVNELGLPAYSLLKPNPVHALSVLRRCIEEDTIQALKISSELWRGTAAVKDWMSFNNASITVYEDSAKGLLSARAAQSLLANLGIDVDLKLIGVSQIPVKIDALEEIADKVINSINETTWPDD